VFDSKQLRNKPHIFKTLVCFDLTFGTNYLYERKTVRVFVYMLVCP